MGGKNILCTFSLIRGLNIIMKSLLVKLNWLIPGRYTDSSRQLDTTNKNRAIQASSDEPEPELSKSMLTFMSVNTFHPTYLYI